MVAMKKTCFALIPVIAALAFIPTLALASGNAGDFDGGVAIGSSYAGVDAAPTNGLIVQGNVGIGTTVPAVPLDVRAAGDEAYFYRYTSDVYGAGLRLRKARGTETSPTAINNGDVAGTVTFEGYDGSTYQTAAAVAGIVNGTVSSGSVPTDIVFDNGTASFPPEHMRITSAGLVGIGTNAPLNSSILDARGMISANGHIANGTTFTITSGCGTPTSLTGGATTGSFKAGQTSCAPIIALPTAPNGWWCHAWDLTTTTDTLKQTATSTTSCTLSGTVTASDVIVFHAEAY